MADDGGRTVANSPKPSYFDSKYSGAESNVTRKEPIRFRRLVLLVSVEEDTEDAN